MVTDVTSPQFLLLLLLPTLLFVYCMVVSFEARRAVFRLPVIGFRNLAAVATRFPPLAIERGVVGPPETVTRPSGREVLVQVDKKTSNGGAIHDSNHSLCPQGSLHSIRNSISTSQGSLNAPSIHHFSAPGDSYQKLSPVSTRQMQTHTRPRSRILDSTDTMFKKAVESHDAGSSQKGPASMQHFFSSSPLGATLKPAAAPSRTPLENGNGNTQKSKNWSTMQLAGIKRTPSGLAKALAPDNAFKDALYQDSGVANKSSGEVYFDENDFDSDVDLDVEAPVTKGQVKYPNLPPPNAPVSRLNMRPTQPRQASVATNDSGFQTQLSHAQVEALHSDDALPWSSSPAEHFQPPPSAKAKAPVWHQYAYKNSTLPQNSPEQTRPSKRRTLPWLQQKAEELSKPDTPRRQTTSSTQSITGAFTPLPKNTQKTAHPWNITASAIKDQQKQLRQKNAKLMKTTEAAEEDRAAAISKKKKSQVHKVFLSDEQQHVLNLVVEQKKSVFFTGSAGTGKSVLLREIISSLRKKYTREMDRVAVTASTGLAACNVGGVTLHSFAGIGLGKEEVPELVKKIRRNQKAKHRWMRTKVLIIDEVSMVDGELFDKLEEIARLLRNNGRPFGGIQLVITGDFFQLPPVPDGRGPDGRQRDSQFAFEAGTWNTCIEHTIGLHHVFRQKDPEFANMLNEMREGKLSPQSIAKFRTLNRELNFEDMLTATELFPTRAEVDNANNLRMRQLQGEVKTYEAKDTGTVTEKQYRDKLLGNCMAVECLTLKKGAQVMLIKNIDETLVNGSLGKIIGFMSEQMFDNYQQHEEEYYAAQTEGGIVEENEAEIPGLKERRQKIKDLMASTTQHFPVVRFTIADGSTRDLLCQREVWKVELPNGEVQAQRAQIPLILAWALSIHKAQGQTLERVKVDLGRVFEKGQAYVALSRAVSMQGLQIQNFNPSKVVAHERVRTFYNGLSRAEELIKEKSGNVKSTENRKATKARTSNAEDYEKRFLADEWEL